LRGRSCHGPRTGGMGRQGWAERPMRLDFRVRVRTLAAL
jgi:hypothetical protein